MNSLTNRVEFPDTHPTTTNKTNLKGHHAKRFFGLLQEHRMMGAHFVDSSKESIAASRVLTLFVLPLLLLLQVVGF
jgi:hypothetical protein